MTTLIHDRTIFHTGVEDATTAVLASPIGRYPQGMTVQDVLADLDRRLVFAEGKACGTKVLFFTMNAYLLAGKSFSANAYIHKGGVGSITANAVIKKPGSVGSTHSFTANAFIIEVVC